MTSAHLIVVGQTHILVSVPMTVLLMLNALKILVPIAVEMAPHVAGGLLQEGAKYHLYYDF